MTVLPSQKLSIGELFISLAAGLMLFLLPNDARNNFSSPVSECSVLFFTLVIILALYFILKRFEAVGSAMLTASVLNFINIIINIIGGIIYKGDDYWFILSDYNIICMFIIWTVPFFCMTSLRILLPDYGDTNEQCMGYARFLTLSMRAMLIMYGMVIVFKMIFPYKPNIDIPHEIDFMIFNKIQECIANIYNNGILYMVCHTLILLPLSFYFLLLIPTLKWWHILIISLTFGITIEILQYSFNTGTACIDDIIMYIVGAMIGTIIKHSIDKLRSILTYGQDNCMLSMNYTSIKNTDNAFIVSDDEE